MKKSLVIILALCIISLSANAQFQYGLQNDNYGGMNKLYFNPSLIVDSPHKLNVGVVGVNANVGNNYFKFLNMSDIKFDSGVSFREATINDNGNYLGIKAEVRVPSLIYQVNSKNSFGIGVRGRVFANLDNVSQDALNLLKHSEDKSLDDLIGDNFTNQNLDLNINTLIEVGGTYARNIVRNEEYSIDAGLTAKYLISGGAARVYTNNVDLDVVREKNIDGSEEDYFDIATVSGEISYTQSSFDDYKFEDILDNPIGKGFGLDLGINFTKYRASNIDKGDIEESIESKKMKRKSKGQLRPYRFKVGLSVTDIGKVKMQGDQVRHYTFTDHAVKVKESLLKLNEPGSLVKTIGLDTNNYDNSFSTKLPTALNFHFDYSISPKFFTSFNWVQRITNSDKAAARRASYIAITPRFEAKNIGVALPISFAQNYKTQQVGLAFRLAYLTFGTNNLAPLFGQNFTGADVFFGISLPFFRKEEKSY